MECLPWENAMLKPLVCLCFDHTDADSAWFSGSAYLTTMLASFK